MSDFPTRLEQLFRPIDAWGEFRKGARRAAVVFVFYQHGQRWMVPFVRRRADLRDHPGQVALPGGGVQPGESAWEAAQREVQEEIGVRAGSLVPLGAGDPIYASVSNFSVVAVSSKQQHPVLPFVHDEHELDAVLAIPLDRLLDDSAWLESDDPWRFRYLAHEEGVVWGLTERIVAGLAPKLKQALDADRSEDPPADPA